MKVFIAIAGMWGLWYFDLMQDNSIGRGAFAGLAIYLVFRFIADFIRYCLGYNDEF